MKININELLNEKYTEPILEAMLAIGTLGILIYIFY